MTSDGIWPPLEEKKRLVGWWCPVCRIPIRAKKTNGKLCYCGCVIPKDRLVERQKKWRKMYIINMVQQKASELAGFAPCVDLPGPPNIPMA